MWKRFLAVVVAAMAPAALVAADKRSDDRVTCRVDVSAPDGRGGERPARRVSASVAAAVVFRGKVSQQEGDTPPLLFDVFNPRGQRYQVLVATPRVVVRERRGHRFEKTAREREASLAVAGSSIAWTSMYGRWRVEPRIEGERKPCGRPEYFTIRP